MSTLVVVLTLAGLLGGLVFRFTGDIKPATERKQNHRDATARLGAENHPRASARERSRMPSRRVSMKRLQRSRTSPPLDSGPLGPTANTTGDEAVKTPWWRRLVALVELAVLTTAIGVAIAVAIAVIAVLAGSLLSSAI